MMDKPHVICHMTMSVDGKVTGNFLYSDNVKSSVDAYYDIHRQYKADAFACGRITMEGSFTEGWYPILDDLYNTEYLYNDYIADSNATFFAVAFDNHGQLGWKNGYIEDDDPGYANAHIIEVLCEDVSGKYLAYLQKTGVSYIFAGKKQVNISFALDKLKKLFGIKTLLLEGGSILNGAFLREGFVDELSIVIAPVVASAEDKLLFADSHMTDYELTDVKEYKNGIVWLNYKKLVLS